MLSLNAEILAKLTRRFFFNINTKKSLCSSTFNIRKYQLDAPIQNKLQEKNFLLRTQTQSQKKTLGFAQQQQAKFISYSKQLLNEKITDRSPESDSSASADLIIERHNEGE